MTYSITEFPDLDSEDKEKFSPWVLHLMRKCENAIHEFFELEDRVKAFGGPLPDEDERRNVWWNLDAKANRQLKTVNLLLNDLEDQIPARVAEVFAETRSDPFLEYEFGALEPLVIWMGDVLADLESIRGPDWRDE